ncbi:MAG: mandelate racemase, partial [Alphaproteobacteria bacterium]|nr:mandelate racemase [Alphaproteobacteria bacterium]
MNDYPIIKKITFNRYEFPLENMRQHILSSCYEPGSKTSRKVISIKIDTDLGISGEYFSIAPGTYDQMRAIAPLLIGENGLNRENFYNLAKVILRKQDKMGIGPMDIALWDLAGKYYDTPIFRLLGGNRTKLPAYASTLHGDYSKGGLNSPEAFRDFAE